MAKEPETPKSDASGQAAKNKEPSKKKDTYSASLPETYVKRKKRRKTALAIFLTGLAGCTILGIIAFIGPVSGNFTIEMGEGKAALQMSANQSFDDPSTYLKATGLSDAQTITADMIDVASEDKNGLSGAHNRTYYSEDSDSTSTAYSAYTFYIRNTSNVAVNYSVNIAIDNYKNPSNESSSLLDIMRVRLFENDITSDTQESIVYGRASNTPYQLNGTLVDSDPIGYCKPYLKDDNGNDCPNPNKATNVENRGYCTNFISNTEVCSKTHQGLSIGGVVRYTVLMWLEGNDPDCLGQQPKNCSVTLSMHFNILTDSKTGTSSNS